MARTRRSEADGVALVVDNPKRDLPGIVLLGHELVQRGLKPYLVPMNLQQAEITALPVSGVLINYLRPNNEPLVAGLLEAGVRVVVCDTEGGVFRDVERLVAKMSKRDDVRGAVEAYCAWGEYMADYLVDQRYHTAEQVVLTGSPRFDFYAGDWRDTCRVINEVERSADRPLVLLCGSFPFANSAFATPAQEMDRRVIATGLPRELVEAEYEADKAAMDALVALSNTLAEAYPDVDFVYRPHPFEQPATYETLLKPLPNLRVHATGTVDSWLLQADFVVVPSDCTIGIEAAMVNVPAVIPRWLGSEDAPSVLSCARSVTSEAELVEQFEAALEIRTDDQARAAFAPPEAKDTIHTYFGPIDGRSHHRVADVIVERLGGGSTPDRAALRSMHYRRGDSSLSRQARVLLALRSALRLPTQWSFRRFSAPDRLSWDDGIKAFSQTEVQRILTGINDTQPALQPVDAVTPGAGTYDFSYATGRAVQLVPSTAAADAARATPTPAG